MSDKHKPLNTTTASEYARSHPSLKGLFGKDESLTCREVGDGNLNLIFVVRAADDPSRSVLIKQALPYIRRYPQHQLTLKRMFFEASYYTVCSQLCREHIPRFYAYDDRRAIVVMENLDRHVVLRTGLVERRRYPMLAQHMGHFLAVMLYSTSDFHLEPAKKKEQARRFINPELCQVTERAVFTGPYMASYKMNRWNKLLDGLVSVIRDDELLKTQVMELKYGFMTRSQALIHGDLHTGSVMVNESDTRVIDPEFCFYGPMGFDIGALLGNYVLNYAALLVRVSDADDRAACQEYLLSLVGDTWRIFEREFTAMWLQERPETVPIAFCRGFLLNLLRDTAGYAGCKIIRRIIGSAHVEDMDGIKDLAEQARAMSLGLSIGERLIMERAAIRDIEDVLCIVRDSRPTYPGTSVQA